MSAFVPKSAIQFGPFELDPTSGELRKYGLRVKLQDQPLQILILLLENPGKIVSRDEIRQRLWPENTFVDFDNSISSAVRKLREALNDSIGAARFIETISRKGYRFIEPVLSRNGFVTQPTIRSKEDPHPNSSSIPAEAQARLDARVKNLERQRSLRAGRVPWLSAVLMVALLPTFWFVRSRYHKRSVGETRLLAVHVHALTLNKRSGA
jgi:DNA-binding winged helix-turn-helix (wHTH) protein